MERQSAKLAESLVGDGKSNEQLHVLLARTEAYILVMGQIRDTMAEIAKDQRAIFAAQGEMQVQIARLEEARTHKELEKLALDFSNYKREQANACSIRDERILMLQLKQARYQGLFLPLSVLGSAALTATVVFLVQRVLA